MVRRGRQLNKQQALELVKLVTRQEIEDGLNKIHENKASGWNGMNSPFTLLETL